MSVSTPWILFHAPWVSRVPSGVVLLEQVERFLAAVAVDPSPDSADLSVSEDPPGPLVEEASAVFGARQPPSQSRRPRWCWERPVDVAPLVAFFREHDHRRAADRRVELLLTYWFEVKRPGAGAPLFPGSPLPSSLMVWLGSRRINLAIRYPSADLTPALLDAHEAIANALEPKPKPTRCVLQRVIPATRPGGREKFERLG
jgi:hypothetical protein